MINELHNLATTLESMKIPLFEWHREYKEIPKVTFEEAIDILKNDEK